MQTENWKKIKKLLNEVLPLDAGERGEFFEKSEINGEIRQEVESLLLFETESEDLMHLSAVEFLKDFIDSDESDKNNLHGQQIGAYQIIRELGYGGMGAVYLAERTDGKFEQKVALKLLKREMNTVALRRRFGQERDILASLEHPNIARLLNAGMTDDKIPFIAMEYVEGLPIDDYCNKHKLDLNQRLDLFREVCQAVDFAHRNLIVHRDLKPSNILVTNEGKPKLLDFGISKILSEEIENADSATITKLGVMTPSYASPEQIQSQSVTTATDIYSLGVILYELLSGHRPFETKEDDLKEIYKAVIEINPPLPSSMVDTITKNFKEITEAKTAIKADEEAELKPKTPETKTNKTLQTNPQTVHLSSSSIRGDLDNIILKALRKEPESRYSSAENLSEDIKRHLRGLPVTARSATFAYRANKFVRRNKISVIAGILFFLSLITGITVAIWQAHKANEQAGISAESQRLAELESERANAETEKAKVEKEKAEKISQFMAKVISYANPSWYAEGAKFGGDVKLIDVLNDLSDKIDIEFADQPDVQAELHHKFTEVYGASKAGVTDRAHIASLLDKQRFHARRALELRRQFYGEKHELVAKDMYYLYHSKLPELNDAELLARAIEMMRETNTKNLNFPYMLSDYAGLLILPEFQELHEKYRQAAIPPTNENKYQLSEDYSREALRLYRIYYKEDNVAIGQSECNLAYALAKQNKMTDFRQHFDVCRELWEKFPNYVGPEFLKEIENVLAENADKVSK